MLTDKILIVYNPNAGRGRAKKYAETLARRFTNTTLFCASSIKLMQSFHASNANNLHGYTLVIIIGGDGTIGPNIDAMLKNEIVVPIYALGFGTANDFATFMRTQKRAKIAAKIISKAATDNTYIINADTIMVDGDKFAISDAAGGAFTSGVTKYSNKSKRIFGKLAYVTKAAFIALTAKSQLCKFTVDGETFECDVLLFYILNTKHVGGMHGAGSIAQPDDGKLDLVCIKKSSLWGKLCIATCALTNRMHKSKHAIYRQGKNFTVEIIGAASPNFTKTDIDGNPGGNYPLSVTVGRKIPVISNRKQKTKC